MAPSRDDPSSEDTYRRTRDTFDQMNAEEQVTFLVEATASMVARGVEQAGRALAAGLEDVFRSTAPGASRPHRRGKTHGPGPAEPETAQQRRPQGGKRDASTR